MTSQQIHALLIEDDPDDILLLRSRSLMWGLERSSWIAQTVFPEA